MCEEEEINAGFNAELGISAGKSLGGSPHVHDLALALTEKGQEMTVLTRGDAPAESREQRERDQDLPGRA